MLSNGALKKQKISRTNLAGACHIPKGITSGGKRAVGSSAVFRIVLLQCSTQGVIDTDMVDL